MPFPHNSDMPDSTAASHANKTTPMGAMNDHEGWMLRGSQLHEAGQIEAALLAFDKAWALAPQDVNAAAACATMLSLLDRPQAAYRALLKVEFSLRESADGAANLAIAAEACGDFAKAEAAYTRALQLEPNHSRALNNVGILAASASQWEIAIELARKCLAVAPAHAPHHANLSEFLTGAGLLAEALEVVTRAAKHFPDDLDLKSRHIALLAANGELEAANAALTSADARTRDTLDTFLSKMPEPEALRSSAIDHQRKSSVTTPDALDIYLRQAARSMALCDWRGQDKLTDTLRAALEKAAQAGIPRDWSAAAFFAPLLDLREEEIAQMHTETMVATRATLGVALPAFSARPLTAARKKDHRIHVGLAIPSLHDESQSQALARQLAHHDADRFAIHVYAFTREPHTRQSDVLTPHAEYVAELAHMLYAEAAARMRLDQLDVYVELGGDLGGCPQEVAAWRVAPVQLRQLGWDRRHAAGHWDYSISDSFIHAHTADLEQGPIVRLPHTCWLTTHGAPHAGAQPSREAFGLPADALVLSSFVSPVTLDSHSFTAWMKILRSLPDAVLWLPHCGKAASHLVRQAQASGVGAERLFFSRNMDRSQALAGMQLVDLLLDPLRVSAPQNLEDALRMGTPAISCAGKTMASRLGGSVLHAAGLPEAVFANEHAYVAEALHLGRDALALRRLRDRVRGLSTAAPLFDLPSRVRDWEAAWTTMVERSRAGLPPVAFDVLPTGKPVLFVSAAS